MKIDQKNKLFDESLSLYNNGELRKSEKILNGIKEPDLTLNERIQILRIAIKLKEGNAEYALKELDRVESSIKQVKDHWINLKSVTLRSL